MVAAFAGGCCPTNKPMRISNWTQFAKLYGDPENPDNGPFMEGAFLAHSVFGFFQNGGQLAWIIRVGSEKRPVAPRAGLPAANDKDVEALRLVALDGVSDQVQVEVAEEPPQEGKDGSDTTYNVIVTAGSDREEYPGVSAQEGPQLHRHEGQRRLQADQDRGDGSLAARDARGPRLLHAVGALGGGGKARRRRLRG